MILAAMPLVFLVVVAAAMLRILKDHPERRGAILLWSTIAGVLGEAILVVQLVVQHH
jgi:hypothetical protein